jgi:MscS family membrane protein
VGEIGRMYAQISPVAKTAESQPVARVPEPLATPHFYQSFISTPGYLAPPKWYVRLPAGLRQGLELSLVDQTLFQVLAAGATLLLYGWAVLALFRRLLHTYRYYRGREEVSPDSWHQDNAAWTRVLLTLPVMPLTRLSDLIIDDLINFTGVPLVVVTCLFFICNFIAASIFVFYLFEALGRSLAEWLVHLRGGSSELQLRRVSNLVMPVCRVLGGLVALALIYRLLIMLGLPSSTVLAFSAVPGLAIGLGASKLLGNLFAGLSIQTDRPVRVGEFCRIGDNLGFVTRIGLRSLELQTLESRVTIPNAIADEETIVNYSRRQRSGAAPARQSLALRLRVEQPFSPEQVADLLAIVRRHLDGVAELQQPLVSLEQEGMEAFTLLCHGLVELNDWPQYLALRERVLLRLEELVEQVRLSQRQVGVSYDTSSEHLQRLPELITAVVERDPLLELKSCRLMAISEFSYDYSFRLHAHHDSFGRFKDAIHRLNRDLLACFAAEGIEIPYPTAVEIQKDA